MGKQEELTSTMAIVKDILVKNKKARNSDFYLYIKVMERLNKGSSKLPFDEVLNNLQELGLPCYDTVTRARRKIQEKNPDLQSDRFIAKCREENQKVFEDFARS